MSVGAPCPTPAGAARRRGRALALLAPSGAIAGGALERAGGAPDTEPDAQVAGAEHAVAVDVAPADRLAQAVVGEPEADVVAPPAAAAVQVHVGQARRAQEHPAREYLDAGASAGWRTGGAAAHQRDPGLAADVRGFEHARRAAADRARGGVRLAAQARAGTVEDPDFDRAVGHGIVRSVVHHHRERAGGR